MDYNKGIVCNLTGDIADFDPECENFERDEKVKDEIKVEDKTTSEIIDQLPANVREQLLPHQDLLYAVIGGLFLSVICGLLWAVITVSTGYQIGYMAIGVGLIVGMGVRFFGAGIDQIYGFVGAVFALLGCLIGNLFSQVGFIAQAEMLGYFETLSLLSPEDIMLIFSETFSPMDIVFYGIAVYEGYKFAFRTIPSNIAELNDLTPAYSNLRLPLVIVCFVTISVAGYSLSSGINGTQTYYHENGSVMSSGEMVKGKEEGIWEYFYENGKPHAIASFKNGLEHGKWTWYYESGQVMRTGDFKNSLLDGVWLSYFENKNLNDSSVYQNGRLSGGYKSFYENGELFQQGEYARDLRTGSWTIFHEGGTKSSEGKFEKSEPVGPWKFWNPTGELQSEFVYTDAESFQIVSAKDFNGKPTVKEGNGIYFTYYETGSLMEKVNVKDGLRVGNWTSYYEDGKKREEGFFESGKYLVSNYWSPDGNIMVSGGNGEYLIHFDSSTIVAEKGAYVNGLKDGYWETNHPNSIVILQENNYSEGKLHGRSVTYFESGQILVEGRFENDERSGNWTWYHESGLVQCSVSFQNGKKNGSQIFLSETGEEVKEEIYKDGKLVSETLL